MLDLSTIQIQSLKSAWWKNIPVDVLRLDRLHPIVSGNKWFKLRYYLEDAAASAKDTVATFGGAYSNHLVATAFACRQAGLHPVGIVRGEKPPQFSASLTEAADYGMELHFSTREAYRHKSNIIQQLGKPNWYWVGEGGYGTRGMQGAGDILRGWETRSYSHIICACGTGTTLAGMVAAAQPSQHCLGVAVLKGHDSLEHEVMELLPPAHRYKKFGLLHGYHFGGYAKHPAELLEWMNELWRTEQLPTDIVYTAKLMYAVRDLVEKNYFGASDRLLVIHSGGLQGNRSLAPGTLEFL